MKREWRELDREKYWGIEMRSILWIERVLWLGRIGGYSMEERDSWEILSRRNIDLIIERGDIWRWELSEGLRWYFDWVYIMEKNMGM